RSTRSTTRSGNAPYPGLNWLARESSRYVRVACMCVLGVLASVRLGVYFLAMTFNRMGTVPLPLALHLASYTVLGLFCFFAGSLNLIDPVKIPHGLMFLAVCGFSWGYACGSLMARTEAVMLGFLATA